VFRPSLGWAVFTCTKPLTDVFTQGPSWVHMVHLLYEAMQDESAELCFIFCGARSVLYIPLENIVPEILLRIRCNKLVKVPLTLVHYGKYCMWVWSQGKYSTRLRLVLYTPLYHALVQYSIVHSLPYFN